MTVPGPNGRAGTRIRPGEWPGSLAWFHPAASSDLPSCLAWSSSALIHDCLMDTVNSFATTGTDFAAERGFSSKCHCQPVESNSHPRDMRPEMRRTASSSDGDALAAPAGAEDTRTKDQRYHDALAEAMTSVRECVLLCPFHHQIVIHRWGWTLVVNPDGTTMAWNKDKTGTRPRSSTVTDHPPGPGNRPGSRLCSGSSSSSSRQAPAPDRLVGQRPTREPAAEPYDRVPCQRTG